MCFSDLLSIGHDEDSLYFLLRQVMNNFPSTADLNIRGRAQKRYSHNLHRKARKWPCRLVHCESLRKRKIQDDKGTECSVLVSHGACWVRWSTSFVESREVLTETLL